MKYEMDSTMEYYVDLETNQLLASGKIKIEYRADTNKQRWPLHSHSGYEIYFFHEGNATYLINNLIYDLKPGDMLIFNGEHSHKVNPGNGTYIRSYINFHLDYIKQIIDDNIYQNIQTIFELNNGFLIRWTIEELIEVEKIFSNINEENRKEEVGYQSMIESYLGQLLIKIYRKSKGVSINLQCKQKNNHAQRILKYINENFMKDLTLDHIAETVHLNKYYMSHCFKEVTGFTINKYIAQKRIEEGKKLLLSTELSISSISCKIGLNSAVHFSRLFKQYEKIPPKEFRKSFVDMTFSL
ncbi:AraC family transcriptional regulator [Lederbergia citri]|uniref:Helix-turn-helix transcriptional regulator n=1 Tax=Lederbergia citri TaxID=2833580 RepID=A0A942TGD8_9BACI|nr:AraC family transcriptional regulator [Lederbergia citri]MBS4195682.1 helix-turn-helix transcriptional regulator [Lederbergia citri]